MKLTERLIELSVSLQEPVLRDCADYIKALEEEVKTQQDRIKLLEREVAYAENGYNQKYKPYEVSK